MDHVGLIAEVIVMSVVGVIVGLITHLIIRNLGIIKFIIASILLVLFGFLITYIYIIGNGNTTSPIFQIPVWIVIMYHGIKIVRKRKSDNIKGGNIAGEGKN